MTFSPTEITPNMDKGTQASVINNNFKQLVADSVTRVVTDNDGNGRVLIGRKADGSYGVDVSLEGREVVGAKSNDLVMSSDFNMYKIVREGYIEPVPRAGTVTLSGNNIGYSLNLLVSIDKFAEDFLSYDGTITGKTMMNVCFDDNKEDIRGGGIFWEDGTNRAYYDYSAELRFNTNMLNIQFNIRLGAGTVSFVPMDLFYRRIYWQLSNPTRDAIYGMGAGAPGAGKYVFVDTITYNQDGTEKVPLQSTTYQFLTPDIWQRWPSKRLRLSSV